MRIISGNRRGHKLVGFEGSKIRPTTDRVKESVFNLIQGFVADSSVLDLFGGSGALGFEALSRGARSAVFVDADKASVDVIAKNAAELNFGSAVRILHTSYQDFFKNSSECFDLIFLDPPYNKGFIEPVLSDLFNVSGYDIHCCRCAEVIFFDYQLATVALNICSVISLIILVIKPSCTSVNSSDESYVWKAENCCSKSSS